MYHLITENALEGCFPNVEIALRMYLTMMVTIVLERDHSPSSKE